MEKQKHHYTFMRGQEKREKILKVSPSIAQTDTRTLEANSSFIAF
jgi:hypothetical protein